MEMKAEDVGKSEWHTVMVCIQVAILLDAKAGKLPTGLSL
jgi:hypothetical protein